MESYEVDTNTRVEFGLFFDGSVLLESVAQTGVAERMFRVSQRIVLPVAQSKKLYEQLKEHFGDATDDKSDGLLDHLYDDTTLPEEPEEAGLYVSQQGHVLRKYSDNDWGYAGSNLILNDGEKQWSNDARYTHDWGLVVKDLSMDAFPLKRIDRNYISSLAQSKSEE